MNFILFIVVCAFSFAKCDELDCECGIQGTAGQTRIVNGSPVGSNTYPWMVAMINTTTFRQFCGGTLINDRWILTAAHCVPNATPNEVLVITSTIQLDQVAQENARYIDQIWTHPEYTGPAGGHRNDIALLHLTNAVQFSPTLSPICLPSASQLDFDNLFYLGWGKTGVNEQASNDLLYIDTKESDECYKVFSGVVGEDNGFWDKQFCTHSENNGICQGDSGGPLSSKINGRVTQVGINSYVAAGTCGEKPDVTTRVSSYLEDIKSVTEGSNYCRNPNA